MLARNQILQERYRVIRQLGQGGMGAVYEAVDERFGTPVALKEITIELPDSSLSNSVTEKQKNLMIKAFGREAKSLAKARHEAIPYVRDYFSELSGQFLVMELVEGDDLAKLLEKRDAPFPLKDVLGWMDQLLDALDYLHNLKPPIIHRDIKPQNLKLGLRRKIKLLDFGIAKSSDKTSTFTNQTFVGATLNYSPIEQILRVIDPTFREFIILKHKAKAEKLLRQNTDSKCDIYSLGATFYHLLTNRLPTDSIKRTLDVWEGKADPLPNPSELNSEIPSSVSALLLKAMEIERRHRFSSAIIMQTELQALILEERNRKNEIATAPLAEPITEEKENSGTYQLMQAKTERLIPLSAETYSEESDDAAEQPVLTKQAVMPTDTKSSAVETAESPLLEFSDVQSPENLSKSALTGTAYFDEKVTDNKQTSEPLPLIEKKVEPKSDNELFWVLPVTAICIFAIIGIGGMFWYGGSNSTDSNKPKVDMVIISAPTVTPTVSPTVEPSVLPGPSPTLTPMSSNTNTNSENPKPDFAPATDKPALVKKMIKTPTAQKSPEPIKTFTVQKNPVARKTPKPIKTPDLSDDCIYNGKCQ